MNWVPKERGRERERQGFEEMVPTFFFFELVLLWQAQESQRKQLSIAVGSWWEGDSSGLVAEEGMGEESGLITGGGAGDSIIQPSARWGH